MTNNKPLDRTPAAQPDDPYAFERELIIARRKAWGELPVALEAPPIGVAFSGGGIRSATFCLGLSQSLARRGLLAEVDYLSTVSGGGYTGGFIGSLFLPRTDKLTVPRAGDPVAAAVESTAQAAVRANQILADPPDSMRCAVNIGGQAKSLFHPLRWLRENGRYLTPAGPKDTLYLAAVYLRALVGVYYVLGLALFALAIGLYAARLAFGLARGFESAGNYWHLLDPLSWGLQFGVNEPARLWASPLWMIVPVVIVLAIAPLVLTYWLVYVRSDNARWTRQDVSVELSPIVIAAAAIALIVWRDAWPLAHALKANVLWLVAYYAVYLMTIAWVLRAPVLRLWPGSERTKHSGDISKVRQVLTKWLALWIRFTLLAAAAALVDSLGQSLFVSLVKGEGLGWGAGGAGLAAAIAALRQFARFAPEARGWAEMILRFRKAAAMLVGMIALFALMVVAVAALQAVAWSPMLAGWFDGSNTVVPDRIVAPHRDLLLVSAAICAGLLLLVVLSPGFLNNSTLHRFYAARLTRSFLGAANFERMFGFAEAIEGRGERPAWNWYVQEAHFGDDVGLSSYYGARSAAPLHIVNVTLNESLSATSSLMRQDRKGAPAAIGPAGLQVAHHFHPWDVRQGPRGIGHEVMAVAAHPRANECERQPLGTWVAISGAAVSTGLGSMSSTGFSILTWLANARLGYWWKSAAAIREPRGIPGKPWLGTYDLVLQELFGGFIGRSGVHWNLSDGGHFENTGVYELVRRRVPLIVCADNGADDDYTFSDVERLVRRVRVDLGVEIEFLDAAQVATLAQKVKRNQGDLDPALFGEMMDFKPAAPAASARAARRCALLAFVRYRDDPARRSLLVVVKPVIADFVPADVRLYANDNPAFPQQGTGDQFFDEAQWESYRRLGEALGEELLRTSWYGWVAAARLLAEGRYDTA